MDSHTKKDAIVWTLMAVALGALCFGIRKIGPESASLFTLAIFLNMLFGGVMIFARMTRLITYKVILSAPGEYFLVTVGLGIMALALFVRFLTRPEGWPEYMLTSTVMDVIHVAGAIVCFQTSILVMRSGDEEEFQKLAAESVSTAAKTDTGPNVVTRSQVAKNQNK